MFSNTNDCFCSQFVSKQQHILFCSFPATSNTMKFTSAVLALAMLIATTDAFVPSSSSFTPSSTLVQRSPMSDDAMAIIHQPGFGVQPMSTSRHATALQMNLFNRFVKVSQANALRVLQSLEAPEKIMNQALLDMQSDLVKVRQSYAEIISSQRRLVNERDEAQALANRWYERAQLALKAGNDSLAKEALNRKQQQMEVVQKIQLQIDGQSVAADRLYEGLRALEGRIMEAKAKKNQMVARAKAAESTQQVNDMLSGLTGRTPMDAFKRMEEKVEALEAAAEASAEFANLALPSSSYSSSDIEREFLLLEGNASVEEEFARMKSKMIAGSTEKKRSMAVKEEKIFDPSIESEFEKLKITTAEPVKIPVWTVED